MRNNNEIEMNMIIDFGTPISSKDIMRYQLLTINDKVFNIKDSYVTSYNVDKIGINAILEPIDCNIKTTNEFLSDLFTSDEDIKISLNIAVCDTYSMEDIKQSICNLWVGVAINGVSENMRESIYCRYNFTKKTLENASVLINELA